MHILHLKKSLALLTTLLLLGISQTVAQTNTAECGGQFQWNLTSKYEAAPVTAPGWAAQLVFQDIVRPRSIVKGPSGQLLVLSQGFGIVQLELKECPDGQFGWMHKRTLMEDKELNHGLQLSPDGKTLYASTNDAIFAWPYIAEPLSLGTGQTILTGMKGGGHVTRTILLSEKAPGYIIVSHGSDGNLDPQALNSTSGSSSVKAFNIGNQTASSPPFDFVADGIWLGRGLRNSVGLAEVPNSGEVYAVENSADDLERDGTDIHENNPGEELNYLGSVAQNIGNASRGEVANYGYPTCFALWDNNVPNAGNLKAGNHFALNSQGQMKSDTMTKEGGDAWCEAETIPPRLTFQPHNAPLDIKFNEDGTWAYVAFHGSWNSPDPVGYKVSRIEFKDGQPVSGADDRNAAQDLFTNGDISKCPSDCFRPAGLLVDHERERIWVTSDSTGEVWALSKSNVTDVSATGTTTAPPAATSSESGAAKLGSSLFEVLGVAVAFVLAGCA